MKVSELMRKDTVTVRLETTVKELYALMRQYGLSNFPVVDQDHFLQGVMLEENLLQFLYPNIDADYRGIYSAVSDLEHALSVCTDVPVEKLMTRHIRSVDVGSKIENIIPIMLENKVQCLPVASDGRIVGMIYEVDIFNTLMTQMGQNVPQEFESRKPQRERASFQGKEKRVDARVKTTMQVAYKVTSVDGSPVTGKATLATAVDISSSGLLIETQAELPVGGMIDVGFELPSVGRPVKRLARVCRCVLHKETKTYHAGIMFLAMSVQESAEIRKYIEMVKKESSL